MKMNGADAILRSLEAEGVDVMFGIPGGAIMPTYDAMARGTTVRHVLARHEQGAGHMAQGYARASGRVGVAIATSGPGATNLVTPIADAWMDSTPLVCITGQVRVEPDRHRRLPGVRHHRHHDADRQALVARPGRRGHPARDEGGVPRRRAPAAAGPCSSTCRATSRRPSSTSATRTTSTCPAGGRRRKVHPLQIREAAQRDRRTPRSPSSTSAAARSTATPATSCASSPRPAGCRSITTLMGKGAFPETHELLFRLAGHARAEVVEPRDEHVRRARRDRRALRRPRHRQALGVRARARRSSTSTSTPPRSRSCATPTSRSSGR